MCGKNKLAFVQRPKLFPFFFSIHLAIASHWDAPNTFSCRHAQPGKIFSCSNPSTTLSPLSPSKVSSCVSNDLDDEVPESNFIVVSLFLNFFSPITNENGTLTGICSVKGSSFAIVPARSHEFVMVTSDCTSSDQKYPQVVPCFSVFVSWHKTRIHYLSIEIYRD